jgi:deazaflavin-dependent oxidoreductase (nitroreductase family)
MVNVNDWNAQMIEEFRANEGKLGGPFEGAPMLLLTTTGAKSGQRRVNPMMYLAEAGLPVSDSQESSSDLRVSSGGGDRIYVFASKAGAPTNPDWYHNLVANPKVTVERGTEKYEAVATALTGAERDRIYAIQAERYPGFAEYQEKTTRTIPVVSLQRAG